jgi:hypothetical protein
MQSKQALLTTLWQYAFRKLKLICAGRGKPLVNVLLKKGGNAWQQQQLQFGLSQERCFYLNNLVPEGLPG